MLVLGLAGCEVKQGRSDLVSGKKLFVGKCGSCHVLNRAETKGVTGPNLDQAFQRSLHDGFKRDTIKGVVYEQILYPNRNGTMPAKLVDGRDAEDVAAYVAKVVAAKGKDTGALATAVGGTQKALATASAGKLELDADPNGQLLFDAKAAQATAGPLTLTSKNASSIPHNIAIKGPGATAVGPIGQGGHVSTVSVTLKPGKYEFYCSVPGHEQAGMKGTLTVK